MELFEMGPCFVYKETPQVTLKCWTTEGVHLLVTVSDVIKIRPLGSINICTKVLD